MQKSLLWIVLTLLGLSAIYGLYLGVKAIRS